MVDAARDVFKAITSRKSVRAYLNKPVEQKTIEDILAIAARAPSGGNIQPWQVIVITGNSLQKLNTELTAMAMQGDQEKWEYAYYPIVWYEPYLTRRRKVGWDLYRSLGIQKGDREKMMAQQARNFKFFDAPVGLIFTMDREMQIGSWLDLGMFMQNIMLAARGYGLDTCPQAAFGAYHEPISRQLNIPADRKVICGMAMGYEDRNAVENNFTTEREDVKGFTRFLD